MVSSRSRVPLVRSRSIATQVTRNIVMNGKMPSSSSADAGRRSRGWPSKTQRSRNSSTHGTTSSSATVRGSRRSWRSTRPAVARVDPRGSCAPPGRAASRSTMAEEGVFEVAGAGTARSASGVSSARSRLRASAAAGRSGSASSITWLDTSSVVPASASPWNSAPQVVAEHRVEADRRLVEDEQLGCAEQRAASETRAAGRRTAAHELVGVSASPTSARARSAARPASRGPPRSSGGCLATVRSA